MKIIKHVLLLLLFLSFNYSQDLTGFNPDTVKSYRFDAGKMWTFDYPPTEYFTETYGFTPEESWYDNVRLSALRIPGCSASFISEDGLIVTNYHCSDFHFEKFQKEGEDIFREGFFAKTLQEERFVPGFWADRLEFIKDVTDVVQEAIGEGTSENEKIENREKIEEELLAKYEEETGLSCELVTLYNGGKYSLYGYKRYNDVRIVFTPEERVGQFGGNEDNFTYPRYTLDFTMYRIYDEEGKPLKVKNYFKWKTENATEEDFLFSVGNPGTTNRLLTTSQLEYFRDVSYRNFAYFLDTYYNRLEEAKSSLPEKAEVFELRRKDIGNSQKALTGMVKGLSNPYFMARKTDFENKFKSAVNSKEELRNEYGHLWEAIKINVDERKKFGETLAAYTFIPFISSQYFLTAQSVIDIAEQLKLLPEEREEEYKEFDMESFIESQFDPAFDYDAETIKLGVHLDYLLLNAGKENPFVNKLTGGIYGFKGAEQLLSRSKIDTPEKLRELLALSGEEILSAGDPFVDYILATRDEGEKLREKQSEITNSIAVYQNLLGRALFEVYGTSIPPDATFTLRITDGTIKNYRYNGTVAPVFTTLYGLYNRYYSHQKEYPWELPQIWIEREKNLDLSTTFNFLTTFDLVGGSSGSAVINKEAEIVGLAFDGNIESLTGNFIYQPEINRAINVSSGAIHEVLKNIYKAERIVKEVEAGKIIE